MMNTDDDIVRVSSFDGQIVWSDKTTPLFEVGNFLGGGAAGTVYECEHTRTREHYALKILNPLGYKMVNPALLRKCNILTKGTPFSEAAELGRQELKREHIWWVVNTSNKQYYATYFSEKFNSLRELSLNQCIQIWGTSPTEISDKEDGEMVPRTISVQSPGGQKVYVPVIQPKFADFIRRRARVFREIRNMRKISNHKNVIKLENVLELTQDSKTTIFLVMELANGGELFDRIKLDCGTREGTAKFFFQQLLDGVKHCHEQGVCHRDLKPENLLLQDTSDRGTVLKIADFGFSARFELADSDFGEGGYEMTESSFSSSGGGSNVMQMSSLTESPLRILKSVVGSPFYVAPEVLQSMGYDGSKADIWSLGVILYAMLAGNLPFGQELSTCKRFRHFCKWIREIPKKNVELWNCPSISYPDWLFPAKFSVQAKGLIVSMLHPDPQCRVSVAEAMMHPLCRSEDSNDNNIDNIEQQSSVPRTTQEVVASSNINSINNSNNNGGTNPKVDVVEQPPMITVHDDHERSYTAESQDKHLSRTNNTDDDDDDRSCSSDSLNIDDDDDNDTGSEDHGVVFAMEEDTEMESQSRSPCGMTTTSASFSISESIFDSGLGLLPPSVPSTPGSVMPPFAPPNFSSTTMTVGDLLASSDEDDTPESPLQQQSASNRSISLDTRTKDSIHPPSFHDAVKRSTRFVTAVPATDVMYKVESILEDCCSNRTLTPLGVLSKVELRWDTYTINVWAGDVHGPPVFSLQLYQLQPTSAQYQQYWQQSIPNSPVAASSFDHHAILAYLGSSPSSPERSPDRYSERLSSSSGFSNPLLQQHQELFLVEFIRGQLEIFAFKRFYQWVRMKLSELVKRDWNSKFFEQQSPMVDSFLLQRFQQLS